MDSGKHIWDDFSRSLANVHMLQNGQAVISLAVTCLSHKAFESGLLL